MNATMERERQDSEDNERVPAIVYTWGGWPWKAECRLCTTNSPGQRTREEAREWADSHYHAFHELS